MSAPECPHENVEADVCTDCGLDLVSQGDGYLEMNPGYTGYHQRTPVGATISSFERDVYGLNLPEEVKQSMLSKATSVGHQMHRMGVKKEQLFAYAVMAYLELGLPLNQKILAETLGVKQRQANQAHRIITGTSRISIPNATGKDALTAPIVVISPLTLIKEACVRNNMQIYQTEVETYCQKALHNNRRILEFDPSEIATAVVKYVMDLHQISSKGFAQKNRLSMSTLKGRVTIISQALSPTVKACA